MAGESAPRRHAKLDYRSRVGRPKLRPQLSQKIDTTELDEVPIVIREPVMCQPVLNDFAGANQRRGLFTNIMHGGRSFRQ